MFQSVKDRRKNAPFFYKFYPDVCQLRNVAPLSFSKHHVHKNILDINGDKISIDEWLAILEALKNDRSLHVIAVRSRHPVKKILEDVDTETKVRLVKKYPVLYTKFLLRSVMVSLAECITESSLVTCVEIEGLPLKHEYMAILSKGMMASSSLQTISFHNSPLGDEVFKQLTVLLRNMPIIFHLDLSNCNLSSKSAVEVAETLKCQSLQRYSEGWKQSLRNHDPNLESMCGLRRIILNNNPGIGDDGVKHLAEVLKEDIWLKAIDLQNCGISNIGAKYVLSMLDINVTLYIVDVRDNEKIDDGLVHQIMLKLLYNNVKKDAREYCWTVPQSQFHLIASGSLKKRAECTQIPMKRMSHCTRKKSNLHSSTSVSTGRIQNHTSLIQYLPQMVETKAKLQEVAEHLEIETSLRRKAEMEKEALRTKINELENELLKEKEEKEGYCFVKTEAFDAILETLKKFSVFVEHVKQASDSNDQGVRCDKVKLNNDMKTLLESHVKNIIKEIAQEEQNKLCRYLQNFPQEMAISLTVTEKEMLQTDPVNKSRENFELNKTHFTSREDRNVYSISKDARSKLKMQCDPIIPPVCSYSSLMVHDVSNISKNNSMSDVQNNRSNSFPLSKVKELYEQFIEHNCRGSMQESIILSIRKCISSFAKSSQNVLIFTDVYAVFLYYSYFFIPKKYFDAMMVSSKKNIVRNWLEKNHGDKFLHFSNERKRNTQCFYQCYIDFCKLQNTAPSSSVNSRTKKNMLDVYGDRLKIDEWAPILEALKLDRNLHFIAFRSRYNTRRVIEEANTVAKARSITKQPVLLSKFILQLLMGSLAQCLAKSTSVTCIELDGLPITKEYMNIFCDGIASNVSLQTISFCNSQIGDEGCKQLCLLMRNMPSVLHLDLSNCDLTVESTIAIAETLKYQYLQCFAESWKQSLRYCEPNIESMPGLRRIILNNNVCIGDEGVKKLTDVLKEDLWVRAIDLQNCGISNIGAQSILEILDINSTLCIVDVRDNKCIDDVILHRIMLKLYYNNSNKDAHEYNWIIPRSHMTNLSSLSTVISKSSLQTVTKNDSYDKKVSNMESQSTNQRRNFKKLNTQNPTFANLKMTKQPKPDKANFDVQEKEYLSEQSEKNCFCLMNQEAYDAVIETLGRFYEFLDLMQNKNSFAQECNSKGDGDHAMIYCKSKNKSFRFNEIDSKDAMLSSIE